MSIASEITRIQTAKENIRTSIINKGGTLSNDAPIDEYASAISSIPTSGGTEQWTTEGIASGTEPSGEIYLSNIRLVRNAFSYNSAITKVKGENLYGAYSVFDSCSALTEWNLHFIELGYVNMFSQNCPALKKVVLKIDRVNGSGAFLSGCSELEIADFTVPNIRGTTFTKCYKFQTLIIRNTNNVIPLDNINAFENTPFRGYNDLSSTVYVPQALIEDYKTANNWSTIFAEGHLTFLPLEESEWANKYADGTPINNEN